MAKHYCFQRSGHVFEVCMQPMWCFVKCWNPYSVENQVTHSIGAHEAQTITEADFWNCLLRTSWMVPSFSICPWFPKRLLTCQTTGQFSILSQSILNNRGTWGDGRFSGFSWSGIFQAAFVIAANDSVHSLNSRWWNHQMLCNFSLRNMILWFARIFLYSKEPFPIVTSHVQPLDALDTNSCY